jgi:hypothetical protein
MGERPLSDMTTDLMVVAVACQTTARTLTRGRQATPVERETAGLLRDCGDALSHIIAQLDAVARGSVLYSDESYKIVVDKNTDDEVEQCGARAPGRDLIRCMRVTRHDGSHFSYRVDDLLARDDRYAGWAWLDSDPNVLAATMDVNTATVTYDVPA